MEQRPCGEGRPCALHEAWEEGQEAILAYLESQNLSEFVSETASLAAPDGRSQRSPA